MLSAPVPERKLGALLRWLPLLAVALGCTDEGTFGKFDQAKILTFAVEGQSRSAVIDNDDTSVTVTLPYGADLEAVKLAQLTVSSLANTSAKVGDTLDLSETYELVVTAENGKSVPWQIEANEEQGPPGAGGAGGADGTTGTPPGECDSTVVTYELSGLLETTDTPLAAGDALNAIGPGTLSLRFVANGPGSARVTLLSYEMKQNFTINSPGTNVTTDTQATAGPDECGVASGVLSGSTIQWDTCDYGPAPPLGTTQWGPDDVVGGPGCVHDYTSKGLVTCMGSLCKTAGLGTPLEIDDQYPQPFTWFEYNADLKSFSMRGGGAPPQNGSIQRAEVPNVQPSRTWLSFDATEVSRICEPVPDCP